MSRWSVRRLLWALPLAPLAVQPAQACSITCYGSIIITSLGTDGIKISCPDGATVTPGGTGSTPGNGEGPVLPVPPGESMPPSETPLPPGTGATSNPDPVVTETPTPAVPPPGSTTTPVETPPENPPPLTPPTDTPPPPVEPPAPVDVPPVVDEPPVQTTAPPPGDGVANAPEPASLTLLALAGLGGWGYSRRRRA